MFDMLKICCAKENNNKDFGLQTLDVVVCSGCQKNRENWSSLTKNGKQECSEDGDGEEGDEMS